MMMLQVGIMVGTETGNWKDLIKLSSNERRKEWKKINSGAEEETENDLVEDIFSDEDTQTRQYQF